MRIQSVNLARSIWLLRPADLNPGGKSLVPILGSLVERYGFIKYPKTAEEILANSLKFEAGRFTGKSGNEVAVILTIHNDGLVADTFSSTDDSDRFLDDFLTWLHEVYGLLKYETLVRKKLYLSELYVYCEQSLNNLSPGLTPLKKEMSTLQFGYGELPIEVSGISLGYNPEKTGNKGINFRFERAIDNSFSEDRYFSQAPFSTDKHLALLENLEQLLGKL